MSVESNIFTRVLGKVFGTRNDRVLKDLHETVEEINSLEERMRSLPDSAFPEKTVEFSSGGGMVTATARGDMSIEGIKIDPQVVDPEDIEMLEDLILAAVDGAIKEAREMSAAEMAKLTGGLGLPGGMGMPGM